VVVLVCCAGDMPATPTSHMRLEHCEAVAQGRKVLALAIILRGHVSLMFTGIALIGTDRANAEQETSNHVHALPDTRLAQARLAGNAPDSGPRARPTPRERVPESRGCLVEADAVLSKIAFAPCHGKDCRFRPRRGPHGNVNRLTKFALVSALGRQSTSVPLRAAQEQLRRVRVEHPTDHPAEVAQSLDERFGKVFRHAEALCNVPHGAIASR
jgi:hypothetical protein